MLRAGMGADARQGGCRPRARIAILADAAGEGHAYHVGDEAMLEVALERLEGMVPREEMVLLCPHPRTASLAYGIPAVEMPARGRRKWVTRLLRRPLGTALQWLRIRRAVDRCDVVVVSGGGNMTSIFSDLLEMRLLALERARRRGVPFAVVSQTLGPFRPRHREAVRRVLSGALWVGVRDGPSAAEVGERARLAPDDAAFLSPVHVEASRGIAARRGRFLALSIHRIAGMTDGRLDALAALARRIATRGGAGAVFVPHEARRGRGDLEVAERIRAGFGEDGLEVLPVLPARAVRAVAGDASLVISTRYHGVVFALAAGTPVVAIASDEYTTRKMVGAFERFRMPPHVVDLARVEDLLPAADAALSEQAAFARSAAAAREAGMAESLAPYERIRQALAARASQGG